MRDSKHAESSSAIHRQSNKHSKIGVILSGLGLFLFVFFLIYSSIFIMVPAILSSAREAEPKATGDRMQSTARVLPCEREAGAAASGPAVVTKDLEVILLSSYKETMKTGESRTISASTPGGITVTWESRDPKIASVDTNGVITAHKKGITVITAKTNGAYAKCKISVKKATKRI